MGTALGRADSVTSGAKAPMNRGTIGAAEAAPFQNRADVAQLVQHSLGKLSRLAGVSEAGDRWRNPERSRGSPAGVLSSKGKLGPM